MAFRKIINDPVYGFITIDNPLIFEIISHPWYQRLRRIKQMALAHLVYPGAVHTRLHHSLGAYHLMCNALQVLKEKGTAITGAEDTAAKIAILLHDIGHGPFSHALENVLMKNVHHEELSLLLMQELNRQFNGQLQTAIDIFTNTYPKKFLHQLVSGQLDVDRMDYLTRDSFFTGVNEGVIGYDRIIKMLIVHNGALMVEEKAIYSIEKFLVARRLMYWQVYLHKTVLSAEMILVKILERARATGLKNSADLPDSILKSFLLNLYKGNIAEHLEAFCQLDDTDVVAAIKSWRHHPDKVLSLLCNSIMNRTLFKVKLQSAPIPEAEVKQLKKNIMERLHINEQAASYLVFTGEAVSRTYNPFDEKINILFKDGEVKDISQVDNALIQHNLSGPVKKFYICYLK
ncbi:HD domain-containing protein [Agriterribacter sp.]|uniref:HD domain-containing protein n=1 Tax=Agriterribacter sp. TaxID=2821509 RepID=UPI002B9EE8B2|nr:HD domain-containing protein [Agriterribacter sp.]HTN07785.1 HD domain-containing protein [Agriterribacter sp.]